MEFALVVVFLLAVGAYFIVRPGKNSGDVDTTPIAPPQQASDSTAETNRLMRLTKADLEKLAIDAGVDTAGTKADIVSRLIP